MSVRFVSRLCAAVLAAACAPMLLTTPAGATDADVFTQATPPLARGQIELLTLSTLPGAVTGGDVLMAVRGLQPGDRLAVRVGRRRSVTAAFARAAAGSERRGLVTGLRVGRNVVTATVRGHLGRRVARLTVLNHPISGPVISGPHQEPFVCETEKAGLGKPLDADCSIATRYDWYARAVTDQRFHRLADPYAPYPGDTDHVTLAGGRRVPFVVRVESATINRGIARIAVLDDPAARGPGRPFRAAEWDGRLTHAFGESCGSGFHQGVNSPDTVLGGLPAKIGADTIFSSVYGLTERLAQGDVVEASTLTTYGVHCNPAISGETLMMIKEHVAEQYGIPKHTFGVGGSGGALQQYNAANNFPGLLDAASPIATFTDVPSTAMTVVDCGLLLHYWETTGMSWSDPQQRVVAGHLTTDICRSWRSTFLPLLDPQQNCPSAIPRARRYNPQTNPKGIRCSLVDGLVNLVGRDPRTGFARRPYDNVGVQYGLGALNAGEISLDQFLDLNRRIGGYDSDSRPTPGRSSMPADLSAHLYELGAVIGRGSLDRVPIIDMATYLDLIPTADIHDDVRPFMVRQRLRDRLGTGGTMSIWRGVSLPSDSLPALTDWVSRIEDRGGVGDPAVVAASKPAAADDRCIVTAAGAAVDPFSNILGPLGLVALQPGGPSVGRIGIGASLPEAQEASGSGLCQQVFKAIGEPRTVAGEPLTDDVLKCARKPVDAGDYRVPVTAAQLDELRRIFPSGVCDYSRPGIGERARSLPWPSIGSTRVRAPFSLHWTVGRSPARR